LGFEDPSPPFAIGCLMTDTYNSNLCVDRLPCSPVAAKKKPGDETGLPGKPHDAAGGSV
jgi:hypothetical protein